MEQIWINAAECYARREGAQQINRQQQDELRISNPALATRLEALPWYEDPYGPCSSDNIANLDWEWMGADGEVWCWRSYCPIAKLPLLSKYIVGEVQEPSDDEEWLECTFNLKASYAFSVLKAAGKIPTDSILMNRDERPMSYCGELDAA